MITTGVALLAAALPLYAESCVFLDNAFPYRIVCQPEWVEALKNDSLLVLNNTSPGKKTRFQLKKYLIDSTYNPDNMEWSRLNYAVNKELATTFGKLVFVDTGAAKKLGDYRAFEMFAFFSDSNKTQTTWWAEYSRWTEHDGYGFLVSIVGDTIDIKQNYMTYKSLFDSMSVTRMNTPIVHDRAAVKRPAIRASTPLSPTRYDLLGREMPGFTGCGNNVLVGKTMKQCLVR